MENYQTSEASSPEFEFWMVSNPPPSFPQPQHLLTADELFADGIVLPLIQPPSSSDPNPNNISPPPPPPPPTTTTTNPSRKWKQIFRSRGRRRGDKEKPKITTAATAPPHSSPASIAELNIHIWPFARSRSAGSVSGPVAPPRPRAPAASGRKSCSAPCSRSNSRGESAAPKKSGPLAGGVHVGRNGPVWQLKRSFVGKSTNTSSSASTSSSSSVGMLNLNVNTCIGYGSQVRNCRGEDKDEVTGIDQSGARGGDGGRGSGGNGTLFNLRAIFSKKVY